MMHMQSQKAVQKKKLPKGWREDGNAVPLPISRPWSECKDSAAVGAVCELAETIEEVGMEYLLEHLEDICSEQAGLYGDGCLDVFPQDKTLAGIWAYYAKRFGDLRKFAVAYQPSKEGGK
jgi:hypothetical protein